MERFISALSITLLLTGFTTLAQVQSPSSDPVNQVVTAGIMTRSPNGEFREQDAISRAELARILVKTFDLDQRQPVRSVSVIRINDVAPSHWAYRDIQLVLRHGIMAGYSEGEFYPDQRVTRAEAFAIFAQARGVAQFSEQSIAQVLAPYPDAVEIPRWARKSIATALSEGYINLKNHDRIDPLSPMTREDMAYALNVYLTQQKTSDKVLWETLKPLKS